MSPVAMIFEYWFDPQRPERFARYLREADALRPRVDRVDGFLGIERFQSVTDPHRYAAIGAFRDEAAVKRWRTDPEHRRVQALGRDHLFAGYRLRMAEVRRDYGRG